MSSFAPTALMIICLTTLLIGIFMGRIIIPILKRVHASQTEREELKSHKKKEGTPTMGGFIFIITIVLVSLFSLEYIKEALPVLLLSVGFGVVGFLDDYLKVVLKRSDGLKAKQKFLLQFVICILFIFYMYKTGHNMDFDVPFLKGVTINFGLLTAPFLFFVIGGTVNGVNFTDGLDGLASSVTVIVSLFFMLVPMLSGYGFGSGYTFFSVIVTGALLAFLVFNVYPAKTFMGDTGSLFLGGYVSGMAIMLNIPIYIVLFGFIYLAEVLSVIIQVTYFKRTKGKRIFRMAPIHHHYELGGMSETRIVYLFSLVTLGLCIVSLLSIMEFI